jgi:beta-lactamase regulating signal transducer with metallopeptidase domain
MVSSLARASIDGAILVGVIWVLSRLLRLSPATRTMLWWCAAAKFVVALLWTTPIPIPILPAQVSPVAAVVVDTVPGVAGSRDDDATRRARRAAPVQRSLRSSVVEVFHEWSPFATIGWTLGLVGVGLIGVRRSRETARMCAESEPATDTVQKLAIDLALRLRLRRVPEIRVSRLVETPLVMGLLRPVVLLPSDRFDHLTDRQQQMAVCHELAHVKRADLWLGCVPALAERIFFFHPLVHLASREYALSREAACDAAVMETLDAAPQEYGRLLLALGVSRPQAGLTAAGAAWSFLNLKRRIAMLQDVSARSNRSRVLAAGAVVLALAAMIPLRLAARPDAVGNPQRKSLDRDQDMRGSASKQDLAAHFAAVAEERQRDSDVREPADIEQAAARVEDRQSKTRQLDFVLLGEDGQQTMSGSLEDVQRAKRHQTNGEPLLWFRNDGREYVIRDRDVLRQARAVWAHVYESGLGPEHMAAMAQAFNAEALIGHGRLAAEAEAIAQLGGIAAEKGALGAQLGAMASEQALRALADAHRAMPEIAAADLKPLRQSLDESSHEIDEKMREMERRLKQDLDGQLQELQERIRRLEGPIREMVAPMEELGRSMEALGRTAEKASREAMEEMRALIERAIASGLAQTVR